MSTTVQQQKRVMLWAVPRSLSTAMCRVMMNSGITTQNMFEPYSDAYYLGPERVCSRFSNVTPDPKHSYSSIKHKLELPYADKELVFAKDMPFFLGPDHLTADWIPDGYTHTFLTRHPRYAVASYFKAFQQLPEWSFFYPQDCYKDQLNLLRLLQQLGHKAVILDADDLLDNSDKMLRAYCREVGLEFSKSMLNWAPLADADFKQIFCAKYEPEWFANMTTSGKLVPLGSPSSEDGGYDVKCDQKTRDEIEATVYSSMPYYEEMHKMRLVAQVVISV